MSKWFSANKLFYHICDKIYNKKLTIGYNDKYREEAVNTRCLGLQIDNHLNWENNILHLVPKLSGACYAVRSVLHISNTDTLQ
jgi:hypothetical protein